MKFLFNLLLFFGLLLSLVSSSCTRQPFKPDFEHAAGYVIGKEICKLNPDEDYWIIDLSYFSNSHDKNYGDTITINGNFYGHMIKTQQLLPQFKQAGKKISFDFKLSSSKVQTQGCAVANYIIYDLKEMKVLATFEIR